MYKYVKKATAKTYNSFTNLGQSFSLKVDLSVSRGQEAQSHEWDQELTKVGELGGVAGPVDDH